MKNILIIKCGALGDVVRTAYFAPGLYKKFNGAVRIHWLTYKECVELLIWNPYIHKVYSFSNTCIKRLKKEHYDWVISLDDERHICKIVSLLSYKKITGSYVDKKGNLKYTEDSSNWFDMGLISKFGKAKADQLKKNNRRTHTEIFEKILNIHVDKPCFYNKKNIKPGIFKQHNLGKKHNLIGLSLSAGKKWPSKKMKQIEAIKLVCYLLMKGYTCVLLGGKDDLDYNKKIMNVSKSKRIVLFKPVSLPMFAAVISRLGLLISSDSLALHLAIAQRIPNISFYSPTSAAEIDTFGTGIKICSTKKDYCSYKPYADNSAITARRVINALNKIIKLLPSIIWQKGRFRKYG